MSALLWTRNELTAALPIARGDFSCCSLGSNCKQQPCRQKKVTPTPPCSPAIIPGPTCTIEQADCFYRVFSDAPLVPSTTVSHKALSLVLHTHQSSAREAFHGGEGGARAYAGAIGGDAPGEVQPDGSDYETRKVPVSLCVSPSAARAQVGAVRQT